MKKSLPIILIAILGVGLGLLAWFFIRTPDEANGDGGEQVAQGEEFKREDFIDTFDFDGDGIVTFEEFDQLYGEPPYIFRKHDRAPAYTAKEAYDVWDRDDNGVIDARDIRLLEDKAWERFKKDANARGLHAKNHEGNFMVLNDYQLIIWEKEQAAEVRGEVPFAGRFFDPKYMQQWADVTFPDGRRTQAFVSEHRGKVWILTQDAKLHVEDPGDVTVRDLGDEAPPVQYVEEIKKTPFDDPGANLALARKTAKWGLTHVADMLYARVLLFQPENQEALDALGLRYDGHDHVKKAQ